MFLSGFKSLTKIMILLLKAAANQITAILNFPALKGPDTLTQGEVL
jgi:hypothetical protein